MLFLCSDSDNSPASVGQFNRVSRSNSPSVLLIRHWVIFQPPHPPPTPTHDFSMGANLSKILFVVDIQPFRHERCSSPHHLPFYSANRIIVHRPDSSDTDDEPYPYEFPVFLSSPYDEKNIVTISDSEWTATKLAPDPPIFLSLEEFYPTHTESLDRPTASRFPTPNQPPHQQPHFSYLWPSQTQNERI